MPDRVSNEDERAALLANEEFYRAFRDGDFAAMSRLWAAQLPVACLHPGTPLLLGRQAVLASWKQVLSAPPPMRCQGSTVQVFGETALVYCYEGGDNQPMHLAATNVFAKEGGAWRMVHHHAGPLSEPIASVRSASTLN